MHMFVYLSMKVMRFEMSFPVAICHQTEYSNP